MPNSVEFTVNINENGRRQSATYLGYSAQVLDRFCGSPFPSYPFRASSILFQRRRKYAVVEGHIQPSGALRSTETLVLW